MNEKQIDELSVSQHNAYSALGLGPLWRSSTQPRDTLLQTSQLRLSLSVEKAELPNLQGLVEQLKECAQKLSIELQFVDTHAAEQFIIVRESNKGEVWKAMKSVLFAARNIQ